MSDQVHAQKERLVADLHAVVAEAESLLKATAGQAGEGASELRAKVQASLDRAKAGIYKYKTRASVGGETAVEAELMCTMRKVA